MVKREKSPETVEDARYFTVYRPYPLNAHWELASDVIAFSRWISACIGTDFLHALHHKPSASGMVLIEVDKRYQQTECLLGEHQWKDFLKKPTKEEADRSTQIFHSLYSTGRECQKDGWKRIHAEASWFKDWDPTEKFVTPYPPTQWCLTPAEDRTNKPLCRPLPVKVKPPPLQVAPPVPGSAGWVDQKAAPSQNNSEAKKNAWAKKPTISPAAGAPQWNKPIMVSASPQLRPAVSPSSSKAQPIKPPAGAWGKPLQSTAPTSPSPKTVPQTPAFPPGLNICPKPQTDSIPPGLTKFNWSDDVDNVSGSGLGSSRSSDKLSEQLGNMFEENVTISLSQSIQDQALYGADVVGPDAVTPELDMHSLHPWEFNIPSSNSRVWKAASEAAPSENLWAEEATSKVVPVPECPHHSTLCKKGICEWRAKHVRAEKRRKDEVEGARGRGQGRGRGKSAGRRNSNGNSSNGDGSDSKDGFSKVGGRGRGRGRHSGSRFGRHG